MEGRTFINNTFIGDIDDKPLSGETSVYTELESSDQGLETTAVHGKQSYEASRRNDRNGVKRSSLYMVSALIFVAILFSGIVNLVHLIKGDTFKIPDGYVLFPKQEVSKVTTTVKTNHLSKAHNVTLALRSTEVTRMELKKISKSSAVSPVHKTTDAPTPLEENSSTRSVEEMIETSALVTRATTEQISTKSKGCQSEWLIHGSSCYLLSTQTATWFEAFADCTKFGGNLVEINDAAEDEFLTEKVKLADESFWIGLTDTDEEDRWIWMTSKTAITSDIYTNWGPGQPNDCCGGEDCVTIASHRSFLWNDEPCDARNKYFCEKELE